MMKLVRCAPRNTRRNLRTFDTMFDELWNSMWDANPARFNSETAFPVLRPAMDVLEEDDAVIIRLDLPGIAPEDVDIEVDGDLLTISGAFKREDEPVDEAAQDGDSATPEDTAEDAETATPRYAYRERRYGAFKRSLRLADTLDTANARATYTNGVLTLALPKQPEVQPKRIAVQTIDTDAADAS